MIKAVREAGVGMITDLVNEIIIGRLVPAEWEISAINNYYKIKGDALE